MEASPLIRRAQLNDAAALHSLHTAAVRTICSQAYAPEIVDGWLAGRSPVGYRPPIERGDMIVAEGASGILGFGEAVPGTIVGLYVRPDVAGRGIGSLLLRHLLTVACREPLQGVRVESTINASSFYERFGFREVHRTAVQRNNVYVPVVEMEYAGA